MALRQRTGMEEERHVNSVWPIDESNQFFRHDSHRDRAQLSGFNPLDVYQRQQRPSHVEQLSHLERNSSLQERFQQGLYEPGSMAFERTMALPPGASGMNLDVVNAMARAQESSAHMKSTGQVGQFRSSIQPHGPHYLLTPNQFQGSHMDTIEGRWSEKNGQLDDNSVDSRFQQSHLTSHWQERNSELKATSEGSSLWMQDRHNDEQSKQLLMDLLNCRSGNQLTNTLDVNNAASTERRVLHGQFLGSSSPDIPTSLHPDREANLNNLFGGVRAYGSNPCEPLKELVSNEKPLILSDSRASSVSEELMEVHGLKSEGMAKGQDFEIEDGMVKQDGFAALDHSERSVNNLSRHSSLGITGNLFSFSFSLFFSHCNRNIFFVLLFLFFSPLLLPLWESLANF